MSLLPLKNPPIAEAIFDIQVELPPSFVLPDAGELKGSELEGSYPETRKVFMQQHTIQLGGETTPQGEMKSQFRGYHFLSKGGQQIAQFRVDGFTFNRMSPYSSFDEYLPEVKRLWDFYRKMFKPVVVRRVALRYINKIILPIEGTRLNTDDFLVYGPHFPDEEDMSLAQFSHQQLFVDNQTHHCANLTLALPPGNIKETPSPSVEILFDIDTFCHQLHFSPSDEKIWNLFGQLRTFKNRLFECSLKPRCLDLFR